MSTPRTFTSTVDALRYGTLSEELTKELVRLNQLCQDTGRAGAISLTLTLKPGKGGQIEVFDDIKVKQPKQERGSSIMFATPEGYLQRQDPRQGELEGLRTVDQETGELKRVATAA